jgi:hypothetical protein
LQNCAKLDMMVDIMASTAPYKPYCKQLGYQDAVFAKYTTYAHRRAHLQCLQHPLPGSSSPRHRTLAILPPSMSSSHLPHTRSACRAQDKCFDDCKGTGKIMGETLGSQFCAITGLSAQRGFPQPPTVAICNAVEQSQVYSLSAPIMWPLVAS